MEFTTPVSMPVTEAQYNELKPLLEAMGYVVGKYEECFPQIATNYGEENGSVSCIARKATSVYNRTFIPTYHRDLFLALAAMTDEPNGIAGEWWKYLGEIESHYFTEGKLYKAIRGTNKPFCLLDNNLEPNGINNSSKTFTKASISEIFAHFGVRYGKEQAEPIQSEMTQTTPLIPQGCTFKEWQRTFLAGCIVQGKYSNQSTYKESIIVAAVDKLISELDKTK